MYMYTYRPTLYMFDRQKTCAQHEQGLIEDILYELNYHGPNEVDEWTCPSKFKIKTLPLSHKKCNPANTQGILVTYVRDLSISEVGLA